MKSTYISILFSVLALIVYQNCSPSHSGNADGSASSFSVESIYPYFEEKPTYFDSVQLTKAYKEGAVWKYQFVTSIVYIDDPEQQVDVEVKINDQDGNLLCPRKTKTVTSNNNQIVIDSCESDKKAIAVKIEVYAKLHSAAGTPQLLSTYPFAMVYE